VKVNFHYVLYGNIISQIRLDLINRDSDQGHCHKRRQSFAFRGACQVSLSAAHSVNANTEFLGIERVK
jgi:hypothetical protein